MKRPDWQPLLEAFAHPFSSSDCSKLAAHQTNESTLAQRVASLLLQTPWWLRACRVESQMRQRSQGESWEALARIHLGTRCSKPSPSSACVSGNGSGTNQFKTSWIPKEKPTNTHAQSHCLAPPNFKSARASMDSRAGLPGTATSRAQWKACCGCVLGGIPTASEEICSQQTNSPEKSKMKGNMMQACVQSGRRVSDLNHTA